MNALQSFATHSFANYAAKNIRVDQDKAGLFCQVPDKSGKWYVVRGMESKKSVYANHCNCSHFATHQHCEHIDLVQTYWTKIYKVEAPKVEAPKIAKVRKPRNGLVRKVRNGGLVKVEQKVEQKQPAKIIELPVQSAKITDIGQKGQLYSNKGFSLMR
jgi:predicted nucleic acid-binding Zn finger protein